MKTNHTYKTYAISAVNQLTVRDLRHIAEKTNLKLNSVFKVLQAFKETIKTIQVR